MIKSMSRNLILILQIFNINLQLIVGSQQSVPQSPCPEIFSYTSDDGEIHGLIKIDNIKMNRNNEVTIMVSNSYNSVGKQTLSILQGNEEVFENIKNGLPIYYQVAFRESEEIPEIIQIKSNNLLICKNDKPPPFGYASTTHYLKLEEEATGLHSASRVVHSKDHPKAKLPALPHSNQGWSQYVPHRPKAPTTTVATVTVAKSETQRNRQKIDEILSRPDLGKILKEQHQAQEQQHQTQKKTPSIFNFFFFLK